MKDVTREAIEQARKHANRKWLDWMIHVVVYAVARHQREMTTDDFWALVAKSRKLSRYIPTTHERRAMGAVTIAAAKAGYTTKSEPERFRVSERSICHDSKKLIWISLICDYSPLHVPIYVDPVSEGGGGAKNAATGFPAQAMGISERVSDGKGDEDESRLFPL